jgi:hypothetical protein
VTTTSKENHNMKTAAGHCECASDLSQVVTVLVPSVHVRSVHEGTRVVMYTNTWP